MTKIRHSRRISTYSELEEMEENVMTFRIGNCYFFWSWFHITQEDEDDGELCDKEKWEIIRKKRKSWQCLNVVLCSEEEKKGGWKEKQQQHT